MAADIGDQDADGVNNDLDNCVRVANAMQLDADSDEIGNACDADLNNDCIVNALDLGQFKTIFFTTDPEGDFNGDGVVNAIDLGIMKLLFFSEPGPSGRVNACRCVP